MGSSDRIIGFSTGAIAKGDFRKALSVLKDAGVRAIELSALRERELPELSCSLPELDLSGFAYVSVHAPTNLKELLEFEVVDLLKPAAARQLPIVVHPDTLRSFELWKPFGHLLLVENMDKRKPIGRTASELETTFAHLPAAGLCFDIAHARQVDPTMIEASQIVRAFHSRLREVHASGVTTQSAHGLISVAASSAYSGIASQIPESVPIILESPVDESMVHAEIEFALDAFSPWLERLRADIDDVLDMKVETLRKSQAENFLKSLRMTNVKLSDFESVIGHMPSGGGFRSGDVFLSTRDLLAKLSVSQKARLKVYLFSRLRGLVEEYPDLRSEFAEQFASVT